MFPPVRKMWKTVPVRESHGSRFRPGSSRRGNARDDVHPAASQAIHNEVRENDVNAMVKQIRRVSAALRKEQWVADTSMQLDAAVFEACLHGLVTATHAESKGASPASCTHVDVRVVALGVGSVLDSNTDSTNASSLLQLGLLHSVVDGQLISRLEKRVRLFMQKVSLASARSSPHDAQTTPAENPCIDPSSDAPSSSGPSLTIPQMCLRVEYFDPVLTTFDKAVCSKLGYSTSEENVHGAYTVDNGTPAEPLHATSAVQRTCRVFVAYMPHASATLYHNLFAVNWPGISDCDRDDHAHALHRLIVIGNDLKQYDNCERGGQFSFTRLMPMLRVQKLFLPGSRSRKLDKGIEGTSYSDIERAFSDLCITSSSSSFAQHHHLCADFNGCKQHRGGVQQQEGKDFLKCIALEKLPKIIRNGADTL